MTAEAAALKFYKLNAKDPVKARDFREAFEARAGEEAYEDFRYALSNLETYGVC